MSPRTAGHPRRLPAAAAALAAVLLGLLPALLGPASPAAAQGEEGFARIAGCISGADNVLVSMVVDESLSLRDSDPDDLRVQGIATAVDSLEQLTETLDDTRVEVSLSTFARDYRTVVDWRQLDEGAAEELRTVAAETLPERNAGDATDYRQALLGAKRQLDARAADLGRRSTCKVLVWFTDGGLDVDAATDAARVELCQRGGILDALRADGVAVVALALVGPGVSPQQRAELQAVAEGSADGATCGTVPIPPGSTGGVYLPASDAAALQRLFGGAGALVSGGTEVGVVQCPGPQCPGGRYTLAIDPGVAGARVLLQGGRPDPLRVTTPSGEELQLEDGFAESVEGADIDYLVRGGLATLDIGYDPYAEDADRWVVRPAGRSRLAVYVFWGAELVLDTEELKAGATNRLELRLLDQAGDPLPVGRYGAPQATVQVGGEDVPTTVDDDGVVRATVDLPVGDLPAELPVTASVSARSRPGGVALGPVTVSTRVPVALPPAYPAVAPKELDFGTLEGLGTARAALRLTGSRLGPTEVCVTGATFAAPGAEPQRGLLRPGQRCVELGRGERAQLPLRVTPDVTADGVGTGEVRLRLSAADDSADLRVTVPARLSMERVVDESTRWLLVAGLLALAVLLPLAMLVGSNWLLARYRLESTSRTALTSVRVTPVGLRPLGTGAVLEPEAFDNAPFSGVRTDGRMPLEGTPLTLRARRIVSLQPPEAFAEGPTGRVLVSATSPYRGSVPHEAPVEFGQVDCCFVLVDPEGATEEEAAGTLVMCVPAEVDHRGVLDRLAKFDNAPVWRDLLAELTEAEREPAPVPAVPVDAPEPERDDREHRPGAGKDDGDSGDGGDDLPPLPDFLR